MMIDGRNGWNLRVEGSAVSFFTLFYFYLGNYSQIQKTVLGKNVEKSDFHKNKI
jgi:hypothetical protein